MQPLPEYDELGHEKLSYENSWRTDDPQTVEGADCFAPFASINNGLNRLVLDLTGDEITEMLSALYIGAEFVYPSRYLQIVANFLKAIHCPIDFEEECQEYPTYTPIITYAPMNPFNNPDEVPDGYLVPPFVFVNEDNIEDYGDYQIGDVLVPVDAITLDLDWFEALDGQLPTIAIKVQGQGKLSLKLLTVPLGGVAVITVDNPPNIADIVVGIITGADNIIDVNRDIVAIPPETTDHVSYDVEVSGLGMHTIYCVFLPILDDALIPVRFGGGLRSIELCDFGEIPMNYVEDIRWNNDTTMLEKRIAGAWSDVTEFNLLYDFIVEAYDKADNAQAVNASQDELINNLDIAQTSLFTWKDTVVDPTLEQYQEDIEALQANALSQGTSIENLATRMEAAEDAIEALQAAQVSAAVWSHEFDFTVDDGGWDGEADYVSGEGFLFDTSENINTSSLTIRDQRITYIELHVKRVSGTQLAPQIEYTPTLQTQGIYVPTGSGNTAISWVQINPFLTTHSPQIRMIIASGNSWYLQKAIFWGRGSDPF